MAQIDAYRTDTGAKVRIPEHWIGHRHPSLRGRFSKTPTQKATEAAHASGKPSEAWTVAQLREHAADAGIDLAGASTKAEVLSAITTPVAGDTPKEN